jgi:phosphoribosyl 1,2-cyclic phosphodiesterase
MPRQWCACGGGNRHRETSATVLKAFDKVDALVLESNHDLGMLASGPYPAFLKQRIVAHTGHLSNVDCAGALAALAHRGCRTSCSRI